MTLEHERRVVVVCPEATFSLSIRSSLSPLVLTSLPVWNSCFVPELTLPSSLKVPQDTCSELSPLGHWDLLRTLLRTLPKEHPQPHRGRLTSSSQRSCLSRLAMSRGVSPDSLAKGRWDERTCCGQIKQRSDTRRLLNRDPVKQPK